MAQERLNYQSTLSSKPSSALEDEPTGVPPLSPKFFDVWESNAKNKILIEPPDDTILENQRICRVEGVLILRSEVGYPTIETDSNSVVALDLKRADFKKYVTTPYEDPVENGKTYYYMCFPYSDHGVYNRSCGCRGEASPNENAKICITFTAAEAVGCTIKAKKGGQEVSGTVGEDKKCRIEVGETGEWDVGGRRVTVNAMAEEIELEATIYGYRISQSESDPAARVTPLADSAGLEKAYFDFGAGEMHWGGYEDAFFLPKPYMVTSGGELDYELCHSDQTKKADGEAPSDVGNASYGGNAMSVFPVTWQKIAGDDESESRLISNIRIEGWTAGMFEREDGSCEEWHGIGMFEGSIVSGKMRSLSGQTPTTALSFQAMIEAAQANGKCYEMRSWGECDYVRSLLTLVSLSTDAQAAFGFGYCGNAQSISQAATGGLAGKGMFFGSSKAQNAKAFVKVFYLENWWGNVNESIQGIVVKGGQICAKMHRPYSLGGEGYAETGITSPARVTGFASRTKADGRFGSMPCEASGSASTYGCDWFDFTPSEEVMPAAGCGGAWFENESNGPGKIGCGGTGAASPTGRGDGSRISCGQPKPES